MGMGWWECVFLEQMVVEVRAHEGDEDDDGQAHHKNGDPAQLQTLKELTATRRRETQRAQREVEGGKRNGHTQRRVRVESQGTKKVRSTTTATATTTHKCRSGLDNSAPQALILTLSDCLPHPLTPSPPDTLRPSPS